MLLRVPDFYDSFRCIAGKCTDTCCVGWEIDIDETSAKRYKTVQGEFGEKLRQNIEDGHFKLFPGDRCPFLRNDGLCDMICNQEKDKFYFDHIMPYKGELECWYVKHKSVFMYWKLIFMTVEAVIKGGTEWKKLKGIPQPMKELEKFL